MRAKSLQSYPTVCDPVDCRPQAPLSMGFSRQEYWSGLPCPPPRDIPDPRIEPVSFPSPARAGGLFATSAAWEACSQVQCSPTLVLVDLRGKMWKCPLYISFPSPTSRRTRTWGPWLQRLHLDTCLLELQMQRNYKGLKITTCVHSWDKL